MTARHRRADIPLTVPGQQGGGLKIAESTDPLLATAVAVSTPGYDGLAAMGRAFVEEFALMGWSRRRIARMFATPAFAGPHAVYRTRGPRFVDKLITDVLGAADGQED